MIFEMTGFLVGVIAIGVPLLVLCWRDMSRALSAMNGNNRLRPRV